MGYNRDATEKALIEAVGSIIATKGIGGVGVNAVARQAKVNKTLIYRYFGNLEGLFRAFAASNTIWPSLEEIVGDTLENYQGPGWEDAFVAIMINYARALRSRDLTLDIMAWECVERNALTIALEEVRERRSNELYEAIAQANIPIDVDIRVPVALISGAINYFAIRSRTIRIFAGAEVNKEEFWTRELRSAIQTMMRGYAAQNRAPQDA